MSLPLRTIARLEREHWERKQAQAANDTARTTLDAAIEALDWGHVGRIESNPSGVRHFTEAEWQVEKERRAVAEQINRNNLTKEML